MKIDKGSSEDILIKTQVVFEVDITYHWFSASKPERVRGCLHGSIVEFLLSCWFRGVILFSEVIFVVLESPFFNCAEELPHGPVLQLILRLL